MQRDILSATLDLVAEHGFHGTSIQMIANRADVGVGSIYRYFKCKDELIHAVYDHIEEKVEASFMKELHEKPGFKDLYQCLSLNMVSYFMNFKNEFNFMEQYFNSPYGFKKKKDNLFSGRFGCESYGEGFDDFLKKAKEEKAVKDLPLSVLYALTLSPLFSIVNDHHAGIVNLDVFTIQGTIEASWAGIKT